MNTLSIKLASKFSELLQINLTKAQFKKVIKRNITDEYSVCCASHDFCDANMVMDEAFTSVLGRDYIFFNDDQPETEAQNEADTDLINIAWAFAKKHNFNSEDIEVYLTPNMPVLGFKYIWPVKALRNDGSFYIDSVIAEFTGVENRFLKFTSLTEAFDPIYNKTYLAKGVKMGLSCLYFNLKLASLTKK